MIKLTLEYNGYKVIVKNDAREALLFFKDNHGNIGFVITYMAMHGIRGVDLVLKIKEISPYMKIIISSGFQVDQVEPLYSEIRDTFIRKLYKLSELNFRIRKIIDSPS